jgi:GntR family transcriptional regulator
VAVGNGLHIDSKSGVPIYLQIKEYFKSLIANRTLVPGDQLPTIRELSVELTVNPNTIAHAYSELEREGLLATRQGRGTFVIEIEDRAELDALGRQRLCDLMENAIVEARALGYSLDDIEECMGNKIQTWRQQMED